jgi:hypothetical protein
VTPKVPNPDPARRPGWSTRLAHTRTLANQRRRLALGAQKVLQCFVIKTCIRQRASHIDQVGNSPLDRHMCRVQLAMFDDVTYVAEI